MRREIILLAILNFLVAAGALILGTIGLVFFIGLAFAQTDPRSPMYTFVHHMERAFPGWLYIELGRAGVFAFLGLVLVLSSIGLLLHKRWGASGCVFYGVLAILLHGGYLFFQLAYVKPEVDQWARNQMRGGPIRGQTAGTDVTPLIVATSLFALHALILLVAMAKLSASMRARKQEVVDEEGTQEGQSHPTRTKGSDQVEAADSETRAPFAAAEDPLQQGFCRAWHLLE